MLCTFTPVHITSLLHLSKLPYIWSNSTHFLPSAFFLMHLGHTPVLYIPQNLYAYHLCGPFAYICSSFINVPLLTRSSTPNTTFFYFILFHFIYLSILFLFLLLTMPYYPCFCFSSLTLILLFSHSYFCQMLYFYPSHCGDFFSHTQPRHNYFFTLI